MNKSWYWTSHELTLFYIDTSVLLYMQYPGPEFILFIYLFIYICLYTVKNHQVYNTYIL